MGIATRITGLSRAVTIDVDPLATLRSQIEGELITSESAVYDQARSVIAITVNRRPLAIVKAKSARDVAAAVRFAGEHELPLAVRSGGHSLAHHSVVDDGIVVDLSGMKRISIDPVARTARAQAGATSGDLAGPAHRHGLALTTGDTASVGLGGLTTGGGIGYMVRKHGLTIDNLLSAQVVTAGGEIITASSTENADLFWAIRGGGGNFGIVTEFTYQLAPVGYIYGGMLMLPATRDVLRGYLEYSTSAPDDLTTIANLMFVPPMPGMPEAHIGEMVLGILVSWSGGMEEGGRAVAPLRALAEPVLDTLAPMPYPEIYRYTDHVSAPHGAAIRSMFSDDLSDTALDAILASMKNASSPFSLIQLRGLGGAFGRVAPDATAFAHRSQKVFLAIIGIWLDPADNGESHKAWTDALWQQVRPEGSGVYVNFLENEGTERIKEAYPATTYTRLAEVKRKYDPTNLFRLNQNIKPRA